MTILKTMCIKGLLILTGIWTANAFAQDVFPAKAKVVVTSKDQNYRLKQMDDVQFSEFGQPLESQPCVFIDPEIQFQTFFGIGGALTDASAEVYAKLPEAKKKELMTAYFDPVNGIGYTVARTNMASCDFSSDIYNYVEEYDSLLKNFSIAHDDQYRVPFIRDAISASKGTLRLYISPWSPPAWMKSNNDVLHGGKLLPQYRQPWANYFIKYIQALESRGIPVWGLTVQNEPMAVQTWESCIFTAEEERDFIKSFLGPTLSINGLADKKLMAWDHNRDLIYQRAGTILEDKDAAQYVWGIGYHWYETWTGGNMQFENVRRVKEAFPDKNLFFTEGCNGPFNFEKLNDWSLGERYGNSILNDLNCGTVAWTDWNVLLDEKGGPNHVKNYCFAPVHADTRTGELIYTNSYYYLGHFSKYILPGAKRIASSSSRDHIQATAFMNPDGSIVVVVLNTSDNQIPYHLWLKGKAVPLVSLPHSITSIIL